MIAFLIVIKLIYFSGYAINKGDFLWVLHETKIDLSHLYQ